MTAGSTADKRFLFRVTSATAFGEGLDGYDLGIISVVLPLIIKEFDMSALQQGLIAASTLAGIFFGAPVIGLLADRFGRRTIFLIDLIPFVVLGFAQARGGRLL